MRLKIRYNYPLILPTNNVNVMAGSWRQLRWLNYVCDSEFIIIIIAVYKQTKKTQWVQHQRCLKGCLCYRRCRCKRRAKALKLVIKMPRLNYNWLVLFSVNYGYYGSGISTNAYTKRWPKSAKLPSLSTKHWLELELKINHLFFNHSIIVYWKLNSRIYYCNHNHVEP